jgi:hypothetical protein
MAFAVAAVVSCGPEVHLVGPEGQPQPKAASAAFATDQTSLIAVLDAPFGVAPNTLRLVRLNGVEVTDIALRADAEAVATAGSRVLIIGGGRLDFLDRSGVVEEAGPIPDDNADDLIKGLVASPDGTRWMWASLHVQPDGQVRSRIYVADDSSTATLVLERTARGHAMQPVAWTEGGPVVGDELDGIGGYVLFRRGFGPAFQFDLTTRALTPITPEGCAFSDLADNGSVTCVSGGREGPNTGGPVLLRVERQRSAALSLPLGDPVQQAGAALFQPGGSLVSLATSPALGGSTEDIHTVLVNAQTGVAEHVSFNGLRPVQWINRSSLLMTRAANVTGGDPGAYIGGLDGTSAKVSRHPDAIGVVR